MKYLVWETTNRWHIGTEKGKAEGFSVASFSKKLCQDAEAMAKAVCKMLNKEQP